MTSGTRTSDAQTERDAWQQTVVAHIGSFPQNFPGASRSSANSVASVITVETERLVQVASLLANEYGSPDLGNKPDPVDEIVYIALSRRTREAAYQEAYAALVARFPSWDAVADAPEQDVADTIRPSGLGARKARSIRETLRAIRERFGACVLPVESWSDAAVEAYLVGLPEVGHKSAACVMAMSLGRATFAVDAHVGRVMSRIAPYASLGLDLAPLEHRKRQRILPALVPAELRRDLHVNMLVHGRRICKRQPRCRSCLVRALCLTGQRIASDPLP